MKENQIKTIDKFISGPIVGVIGSKKQSKDYKPSNLEDFNSFLIIRPGGIGDACLLLPLINVLNKKGKKVSVLAMKRNRGIFEIFKKQGLINDVYLLENLSKLGGIRHKFDVILDSEQSFYTSALIAKLLKPKIIIGFDTNNRRFLYDHFVRYRQDEYEAQSFLNLLLPFNIETKLLKENLVLKAITTDLKINNGKVLTIFTGGNFKERQIPASTFKSIINKLKSKYDAIYLIGGKSELKTGLELEKNSKKIINLISKTTLEETIYILQNSNTLISSDSGPLHMGIIANTPNIIGLFGPGIVEKWGGRTNIINSDIYCIGCNYGRFSQTPSCPYNRKCIKDLENKIEEIINLA